MECRLSLEKSHFRNTGKGRDLEFVVGVGTEVGNERCSSSSCVGVEGLEKGGLQRGRDGGLSVGVGV